MNNEDPDPVTDDTEDTIEPTELEDLIEFMEDSGRLHTIGEQ